MKKQVVIVGAGVIGLTCAWILSEKGFDVKIVSCRLPSNFKDETDYASPYAGAHFRPFPSSNAGDLKDYPLTRTSFNVFKKISKEFPESSVKFVKAIDYVEADEKPYTTLSPGYAEGLQSFEVLEKEVLPKNVKFGAKYDSWCLNAPLYLQFLERRLRMFYNVEFIIAALVSLKEVSQMYQGSTIVNCTGMGLTYKGGYDSNCYTVCGQTLLVRAPKDCIYNNQTITYRLAENKYSFVIPRPLDGGIIVGGTRQPEKLSPVPDVVTKKELIANAMKRFPELIVFRDGNATLDVKKVYVGFRPMRKGGVRLEKEFTENTQIVHCYGFGSSGFEMSWGAAELVSELVQRLPSKL